MEPVSNVGLAKARLDALKAKQMREAVNNRIDNAIAMAEDADIGYYNVARLNNQIKQEEGLDQEAISKAVSKEIENGSSKALGTALTMATTPALVKSLITKPLATAIGIGKSIVPGVIGGAAGYYADKSIGGEGSLGALAGTLVGTSIKPRSIRKAPKKDALSENMKKYILELPEDINAEDLQKELDLMAIPTKPSTIDKTEVEEFIANDAWPRMEKNLKEIKAPQEVVDAISQAYAHPYDYLNVVEGYVTPDAKAIYDNARNIVLSNRFAEHSPTTLAHETHHGLRDLVGRTLRGYGINTEAFGKNTKYGTIVKYPDLAPVTNEEVLLEIKQPEYTPKEYRLLQEATGNPEFAKEYMMHAEEGATFSGHRFDIRKDLAKKLGRTPTVEEVDARIDEIDPDALFKHVSEGSYKDMIGSKKVHDANIQESDPDVLNKVKELTKSLSDSYKAIMKYVPVVGAIGLTRRQ